MEKKADYLYGLVLAGGKSVRMGKDKGKINWHGKEQRYYLYDLLNKYCNKTFISCRKEQGKEIDASYKTLIDTYSLGPYGALLSALDKYGKKSFLVVACDMPFFDEEALKNLIEKRDEKMMATSYVSPTDNLPEPLAAIWEPRSKKRLLELMENGITCPRKALIKSGKLVKLIDPISKVSTVNTNTPEEEVWAKETLKQI